MRRLSPDVVVAAVRRVPPDAVPADLSHMPPPVPRACSSRRSVVFASMKLIPPDAVVTAVTSMTSEGMTSVVLQMPLQVLIIFKKNVRIYLHILNGHADVLSVRLLLLFKAGPSDVYVVAFSPL
jgi:hypothetical protein